MRSLTPIVLLVLILKMGLFGATQAETVVQIDRFLSGWHHAAAVADEAVYFDSLAPGAIFLGTDRRERWTKEEFQKWAEPYFKRPVAWIFYATQRHIYLSQDGGMAWFDEDLASETYWSCRGSGVLEKIAGKWNIRQYNLSFTIPNEITKEIKPLVDRALQKKIPAKSQ